MTTDGPDSYSLGLAAIRAAMQADCRCAEPIGAREALTWSRRLQSLKTAAAAA